MTQNEKWWITTGPRHRNGKVIMGPFPSSRMAFVVRTVIEVEERRNDLWVEEDSDRDGEVVRDLVSDERFREHVAYMHPVTSR